MIFLLGPHLLSHTPVLFAPAQRALAAWPPPPLFTPPQLLWHILPRVATDDSEREPQKHPSKVLRFRFSGPWSTSLAAGLAPLAPRCIPCVPSQPSTATASVPPNSTTARQRRRLAALVTGRRADRLLIHDPAFRSQKIALHTSFAPVHVPLLQNMHISPVAGGQSMPRLLSG